jgi:hypothetical protein
MVMNATNTPVPADSDKKTPVDPDCCTVPPGDPGPTT